MTFFNSRVDELISLPRKSMREKRKLINLKECFFRSVVQAATSGRKIRFLLNL